MKAWRPSTWGDEISLEYGKGLRGYESVCGPVRVFGSNGPVGWTDRALAKGPGVILGRKGAYRGVQYSESDFFVIDTAYYVVPKTDLDMRWLYYAIKYHKLGEIDDGSPIPSTTRAAVYVRELDVPPKAVQNEIARVLGAIDDKIDVNLRINQTLEAMAQAIFKSWFVDFDPVKAKIAARQEDRDPLRAAMSAISGKPETELDALPPEQYEQLAATAALFPDEMEESELGEIPKGWSVKSIGDVARFTSGKIETSSLSEENYISTENMLENRGGVVRASSLPSVATVPSFAAGQVLISNIRPYFKKIWMARFDGGRSPDVLAFAPAAPKWPEFLYSLMYQDSFFEFMTRTAKGAKMPRGDKDAIIGWKFQCPSEVLMTYFSEKVRPHHKLIESLTSENKSLAELRDTLLPKLLSGELSVTEAMVEAEA
ncbi:restriction endonuclease subunit S [Pseudomonadota bacterium DY0742]